MGKRAIYRAVFFMVSIIFSSSPVRSTEAGHCRNSPFQVHSCRVWLPSVPDRTGCTHKHLLLSCRSSLPYLLILQKFLWLTKNSPSALDRKTRPLYKLYQNQIEINRMGPEKMQGGCFLSSVGLKSKKGVPHLAMKK